MSGDRPSPLGPAWSISDGAHSGGTPGFYFLPPMVSQPTVTGVFDADIATVNPVVVICDVTDGPDVDCGGATPAVRQFSITSDPPITVQDGKYTVNWDTKEWSFTAGRSYRVHVLGGMPPRELGFADILLTNEPGKAKKLADGEFIVLNDGRTLPVHFRIEQGVIVPPGDAKSFELTGLPASLAAGAAASVTVTARDENGNAAVGYRGTVTFTSTGSGATLPGDYAFTEADAGSHTFVAAVSFTSPEPVTLRAADVDDAAIFGAASVTVVPGAAVSLEVGGLGDPVVAGTAASVTVTARDAHGNVAMSYTGTVAFTSTDPQATLPGNYTFTAGDAGTHAFGSAVTLRTAGSTTVTVGDEAVATISGSQSVTVAPAAAAELVLSGIADPATAGVANDLTVTARDQFANTATGYTGTVQFSSSDPAATVPTAYQFQASDAGVRTFTGGVTFRAAGLQSLEVSDAAIPATTSVAVSVDPAAAAQLHFTTHPSDVPEGAPIAPPVVVTALDAFNNVATSFTEQVTIAIGANPGGGTLSGSLQVNAVLGVATFATLSISADGVGYTLVASATGVTPATSDPYTVTSVAPTEVHWISAVSGSWSDGSKWSSGAAPTADQAVFIDAAGTYTVTLNVNATVNSLTLGAASGGGIQTLVTSGVGRTLALTTSGTILSTGRVTLSSATIDGPGVLTIAAGGALTLSTGTISAPLVNAGTLVSNGNSGALNGNVTTGAGSLLRVQSVGFGGAALTVASGFTNLGTIEITSLTINGSSLTVNGTLVNAVAATITVPAGGGGSRTLTAQLDNQGTLIVGTALLLNRASADYTNSGTINISGGNLSITQSGTSPSFTNSGTVTVSAARTWTISGGSFTLGQGATLDGGGAMSLSGVNPAVFGTAFALNALSLSSGTTASFATDITTETLALSLTSATVNGPGTLTNAAGKTLTLNTATINAALVNAGTLVSIGNTAALNGSFTTVAGSLLRIQSVGFGGATLTVASSLSNHGVIELTGTTANGVILTVNGTLLNAAGGTIAVLAGAGGNRTLNAQLDNQGTVSVGIALTLNRASADHSNSGTVNVSGGDLTVTHSGTTPSFTNSGTVSVASGRTWINAGGSGSFSNGTDGQILGAGTFQTNSGTALANSGSITAALVRIGGALTSDAPGGFAPTTTEFIGTTFLIPVGAGFAYTNIRLLTTAPSISFVGSYDLPGFLTVAGSSNLLIEGAQEIVVEGEFRTENSGVLTMQTGGGRLNVRGNASFGGGSTNGRLTAGTLLVGGNFTQAGSAAAFAAGINHVTTLDGVTSQTVVFSNPGAATTASHFGTLLMENAIVPIVLNSAVFANGQLRSQDLGRVITSAGFTLTAAGLSVSGLVFDGTPLRVVNGAAIFPFNDVTFRNMDPTVTQLRLDRLNDAVTFNNITFETVPTTGVYLHVVDTDLGGTLFTVTMAGTQPPNHGGRVIESVAGQLLGWPF